MVFSREEYWSGMSFLPPGYLPDPGTEASTPVAPALLADSLLLDPLGKLVYTCVRVRACVCVYVYDLTFYSVFKHVATNSNCY